MTAKKRGRMIIDCIADLHGHYPELEGGDLLIVAGDLLPVSTDLKMLFFIDWLGKQKYTKKIFIAGNHDSYFKIATPIIMENSPGSEYLCDSGTEFEGLKIWGSPWTKKFEGINPDCEAFTCDTEEELGKKWDLIPEDIDILITHGPPLGIMDLIYNQQADKGYERVGSSKLRQKITKIKPKLHVFGHIHEMYGVDEEDWGLGKKSTKYINCSLMNEDYDAVNKPIRVIL